MGPVPQIKRWNMGEKDDSENWAEPFWEGAHMEQLRGLQ